MHEKILLVDDELAVLQGYQRLLHHDFQTDTSNSGAEALTAIASQGPYAVVVSDMRMPLMDGVQLLAQIKSLSPDTVRIMLTGNADIETAVQAVNEGNIFRFLTKPCSKEMLGKTLTAGLMQYRLVTAERDLLEKTLSGSIHVLTEVLSLVNPAAFSRAVRLRRYAHRIATGLSLQNPWRFEIAAMMSQLGCVTLHPDTIEAVYAGQELPPEERARFEAHPKVARDLLSKIPRMEPIAWMIAHQHDSTPLGTDVADHEIVDAMRLGADILRATLAFDQLRCRGVSKADALRDLASRFQGLDPRILQILRQVEPEADQIAVRTHTGTLIVASGQEVTSTVIVMLKNFHEKGAIAGEIVVSVPKNAATSLPA